MENIFNDKGFNFKEKIEDLKDKGELDLSDNPSSLSNANFQFVARREKAQEIIEFARTETEIKLIKNLLEAIKPHLDGLDESTQKSYEYFRMKVEG
ncbi:MAG: hypothetical protein EBY39_13650 [Flavobacteriia bacterium]|nr:hypothetical protein [Flavobacteriia bacterium]